MKKKIEKKLYEIFWMSEKFISLMPFNNSILFNSFIKKNKQKRFRENMFLVFFEIKSFVS